MSKSKDTSADQQVVTVVASTGPNGVNNSPNSKEWKIEHSVLFDIPGLKELDTVIQRYFTKGAVIDLQNAARKAWAQSGSTVDNSTPEEWQAHVTSYFAQPVNADVLLPLLPSGKQGNSNKAEQRISAKLNKAESEILQMYNNGMRVQQLAIRLEKWPSEIISVLVRRNARIHEQDKNIVEQFTAMQSEFES